MNTLSALKSALMLAYRRGLPFVIVKHIACTMRRAFKRWPQA